MEKIYSTAKKQLNWTIYYCGEMFPEMWKPIYNMHQGGLVSDYVAVFPEL